MLAANDASSISCLNCDKTFCVLVGLTYGLAIFIRKNLSQLSIRKVL